jgi:hypothetical protein
MDGEDVATAKMIPDQIRINYYFFQLSDGYPILGLATPCCVQGNLKSHRRVDGKIPIYWVCPVGELVSSSMQAPYAATRMVGDLMHHLGRFASISIMHHDSTLIIAAEKQCTLVA